MTLNRMKPAHAGNRNEPRVSAREP